MNHKLQHRRLIILVCFGVQALSCAAYAGLTEDGIALFKAGKYKEAQKTFDQVLPTKQNDPNLLYYYALTMHQLGDNATAQKTYQQIVSRFPHSGAAVYARQALGLPAKVVTKAKSIPTNETSSLNTDSAAPELSMFALYPGAKIVNHYTIKEETFHRKFLTAFTDDDLQKVVSFYKAEFNTKGWSLISETPCTTGSLTSHGGSLFKYKQGSDLLQASFERLGRITNFSIVVHLASESL